MSRGHGEYALVAPVPIAAQRDLAAGGEDGPAPTRLAIMGSELDSLLETNAGKSRHSKRGGGGADTNGPKKQTLKQSFFNTFKANIGSGILGIPFAFSLAGWCAGTVGIVVIGSVAIYCMVLLLRAKETLLRQVGNGQNARVDTLGDIASHVLGPRARRVTNFFLCFTQMGFCSAYVVFISTNLHMVFPQISSIAFAGACYIPLVLLNFVRSLRRLAPFSIAASLAIAFGLVVCFAESATGIYRRGPGPGFKAFNWSELPIFLGIAAYSFEGIGMVLPIERETQKRGSYPKVLVSAMALLTMAIVAFGVLGYAWYGKWRGHRTEEAIVDALTHGALALSVRICLCFCLLFTHPLQMTPVYHILDPLGAALQKPGPQTRLSHVVERARAHKLGNADDLEALLTVPHADSLASDGKEFANGALPPANERETDTHVRDDVQGGLDEFARSVDTASHRSGLTLRSIVIRCGLVFVTVLTGAFVPHFGLVLGLVGGFGSTYLAFVLPPIIYVRVCAPASGARVARLYCIVGIGIIGGAMATWSSIRELVQQS